MTHLTSATPYSAQAPVGPPPVDQQGDTLKLTFYGVRGSTPCSCSANERYGGNTACVVVEADGERPIVLDLGTGLRFYGQDLGRAGVEAFDGVALVSHLHWDHVQGVPFFGSVNHPDARMEVYAPRQEGQSLLEAVCGFIRPPYFPVEIDALRGSITFNEVWDDEFTLGGYRVRALPVPHVGPTVGYRVERDGRSVAYVSDHQQPGCSATAVSTEVLELCRGVDVLIHDAQYTEEEFSWKHDWGHCTIEYAVEVAAQAQVGTLVLFHHDPDHHDDMVDELLSSAAALAVGRGVSQVLAAHEGLVLTLAG